jgi:uncharacterized repeat protein (TIGR01451 family)
MGRVWKLTRVLFAVGVTAAAFAIAAASSAAPGTNASVPVFDQCANGAPPSSSTGCPDGWINGILNQNNSHYAEDDVTPQRVVLELPKGSATTGRTVEISYQTRKGGVHAYDSLATWNYTQTSADRCDDLPGSVPCPGGPASTFPIPSDPTVVADDNGGGSATSGHQLGGQVMTMYGGTITGVSVPYHDDPSGTGDEDAHVTVTYSVPSTDDGVQVMLLFGGHIAASLGPRGWGVGVGAGSISGGPYHVKITDTDGASVGNRDNQIMSSAILAPANILIRKVAVGGDATFGYTATGGISSPFSITTSGGVGSQAFSSISPGSYTVTESAPPAGWDFTSLVCEDEDGGTTTSGQTANIDLDPGETVTCTYTNTVRPGMLTVVKHVINDDGGTRVASDFPISVSGSSPSPSSFPGAESPGTTVTIGPGAYSVTETEDPGYTASYSAGCSGTMTSDGSATCTITNDDKPASLTVIKHVISDDGGTAFASAWTMNVAGPSPLSFPGAESPGVTNAVSAGAYKITESGGSSGYTLSYSGDCDADGDVSLDPGESKTCTLTNDDEPAELIVRKVVVNDDGGSATADDFSFRVNGGDTQPFEADGENHLDVPAGVYDVIEPPFEGYDTSYDDCEGIVLGPGESATCTIKNDDRPAELIVRKVVVNDDGGSATADDFSFTVNGGAAQPFEADGENHLLVPAGTYDVEEPAVGGYTTSYSNCFDLVVPVGGSATCTITNNDVPRGVGSLSVSKSADPSSLEEPGGPVTFSVRITNTSVDVDVTITDVVDNVFGDLDDEGGKGYIDVPFKLDPGESRSFQFTAQITGVGGSSHVDTVTASGEDENGNPLSASDDARVDILPRLIDLVIIKDASSPTPLNGIVAYTLTVTNKGPDTATNVQLADPAPVGISYLTATPSQGSCSVSPALVTCSLGSIAAGQTVTITVTARATQVGRHVNTATVTGAGGRETNPTDNVDDAVTVVSAPLTPPAKPKPKPKPEICLALTVSPKMIKADGKPDRLLVKVTAGKKPVKGARVLVKGPGVNKRARTNGKGIAVIRINPSKAGIITITTLERQASCGPKRVGVVGVFLAPLTG